MKWGDAHEVSDIQEFWLFNCLNCNELVHLESHMTTCISFQNGGLALILMNLCFQSHNILIDKHNEYLLQV